MGSFRPAAGNPCLHGSHNFAESLVETALSSLRHSCRSELHAFPVARGVDYTFISTRGYFFLPVELISAAIVAIRLNPLSVKCSPATHHLADRCKVFEVALLGRQHRILPEVRDDVRQQLRYAAHFILERPVRTVRANRPAPERFPEQPKNLRTLAILADRKAGPDVPAEGMPRAPIERYAKASFAVSIAGEISSEIHRTAPPVEIPACCGACRFGVITRRHRPGITIPKSLQG